MWLSVPLLKSGCFPLADLRGRVLCTSKLAKVLHITFAVRWVVASPADKNVCRRCTAELAAAVTVAVCFNRGTGRERSCFLEADVTRVPALPSCSTLTVPGVGLVRNPF